MSDTVSLQINGTLFSGWEALTITRSLDSIADGFSVVCPFDPHNKTLATALRPFGYQDLKIFIGDQIILTGTIEVISPSISFGDRVLNIQGRSRTGILVDCSVENVGFSFYGLTLGEIATRVCSPYGIIVAQFADSSRFSEARVDPGQTVAEFLGKLAADAGLLLTNDELGRLVIMRADPTKSPVAALIEGGPPIQSVSASFDGTARFSQFKVLAQQDGQNGLSGTANDSSIPIFRPQIVNGSDADSVDLGKASRWKRALALSGSISVMAVLSGWRGPDGALWGPSQVVTLKAPGAYILKESTFLIAGATLTLDATSGKTSELRLVLPSTYTGEMPGGYPWDQ